MSIDQEQIRLRRGLVLLALEANFPNALTRDALTRAVPVFTDGRDLDRDGAYLQGKGYIDHTSSDIGGRTYHSYRILPAGVDLVEASTTDPGVRIERGS